MANQSAPQADDARELLTSVRDLTRQVRAAQRGTWFPLLLFAVIALGAIPVSQHGGRRLVGCRPNPGPTGQIRSCGVYSLGALLYWSIALALAYAAIAAFYLFQARRRGVGTRVQPYVLFGVIIAAILTAVTLWSVYHPSGGGTPLAQALVQLRTPVAAIGLALLVLAWVEGSRALAWFSVGYLAVVLIPANDFPGVVANHVTLSSAMPRQLTIAGVLLIGSLAFALSRPAVPRDAQ